VAELLDVDTDCDLLFALPTIHITPTSGAFAETVAAARNAEGGGALNSPGHPVWLGREDSNSVSKSL